MPGRLLTAVLVVAAWLVAVPRSAGAQPGPETYPCSGVSTTPGGVLGPSETALSFYLDFNPHPCMRPTFVPVSIQVGWIELVSSNTSEIRVRVLNNGTRTTRQGTILIWTTPVTITQVGREPDRPALADFDVDGKVDLMVHSQSGTGDLHVWTMDGVMRTNETWLMALDASWKLVAAADFNADGKPDLLWHNQVTGDLGVWYMDGSTRISAVALTPSNIDPAWQIVAVADFNADGRPDLIWRHSEGWLGAWLMDGVTKTSGAALSPSPMDPSWNIVGAADFSGDGKPDLLWQHRDGWLGVWTMDGLTHVSNVAVSPNFVGPDWAVIGVGDFNNDGAADLLWRQTHTGSLGVWYMSGTSQTGVAAIPLWTILW